MLFFGLPPTCWMEIHPEPTDRIINRPQREETTEMNLSGLTKAKYTQHYYPRAHVQR